MNTAELKEYLGIIAEVERDIFLQEQMKSNLSSKIQQLGKERKISPPIKPSEPEMPKAKGKAKDTLWDKITGIGAVILSILFGIGILLIPVCLFLLACEKSAEKKEMTRKMEEYGRQMERYNKEMEVYRDEMRKYQRSVAADKKRAEAERVQKAILQVELDRLMARNKSSKATLQKMYEKNIVFPKYRNLVMVCSLYEYICAGRCTELEGHEGAYNILEMEIRLDRIVVQLDAVIRQLEKIRANQFMLYSAVQESTRHASEILAATYNVTEQLKGLHMQGKLQADVLSNQLRKIEDSSAMTAYCAERSRKELHYMNRMNYLTGRNDDVFWNVPPT